MPIDQAPIGQLTARLMDRLEAEYDEGDIGAVALVVEINSPDKGFQVTADFSDPRGHVNVGLLAVELFHQVAEEGNRLRLTHVEGDLGRTSAGSRTPGQCEGCADQRGESQAEARVK